MGTKKCDLTVKHHETAEIRYSFITFYDFEEADVKYVRNLRILFVNKFLRRWCVKVAMWLRADMKVSFGHVKARKANSPFSVISHR